MVEETSQMVDLRTLGALVRERPSAPSPASASGASVPAFGGARLIPPPVVAPIAAGPPPVAAAVGRPSKFELLPLYLLLVGLAFAVLGLSGYVIMQDRPVVIVERQASPPPVSEAAAVVAAPGDEDAGDDSEPDLESELDAVREPRAPLLLAEAEPERTYSPRPRRGPRPVRATRSRPAPAVQPAPPKKSEVSVECILDPRHCDQPKDPRTATPTPKKPSENLPAKLSASQIKGGLAKAKTRAKTCGAKHAAAGARVKAKISVKGTTGRVDSLKIAAPHAGTAVGRCVGAALKQASFPRFSARAIGFEYSVRL